MKNNEKKHATLWVFFLHVFLLSFLFLLLPAEKSRQSKKRKVVGPKGQKIFLATKSKN